MYRQLISPDGPSGAWRMTHPAQFGRILATEIPLGPLEYILDPAKVHVDRGALEKARNGAIDELELEVVADGTATFSVKRWL